MIPAEMLAICASLKRMALLCPWRNHNSLVGFNHSPARQALVPGGAARLVRAGGGRGRRSAVRCARLWSPGAQRQVAVVVENRAIPKWVALVSGNMD